MRDCLLQAVFSLEKHKNEQGQIDINTFVRAIVTDVVFLVAFGMYAAHVMCVCVYACMCVCVYVCMCVVCVVCCVSNHIISI